MSSVDFSQLTGWSILIIAVAILWSLFWKATALWHAARKGHGAWFVAMLFINTLGVLEIIYLFGIEKVKTNKLYK